MRKLTLADASFLIAESRQTPMHVGGLNLYTMPEGVNETEYLHDIADRLRCQGALRFPFGEVLKMGALGAYGSIYLQRDNAVDMDYHIRHSALPKPGRYRELFVLVSRLHSALLDRSRPLWELHLIEGLPDRQFATYFKIHHSVMDGIGAMHFSASMLTENPKQKIKMSPFSVEAYDAYKKMMHTGIKQPEPVSRKSITEVVKGQVDSGTNIAKALQKTASAWLNGNNGLSTPWLNIPRTAFNDKITGARRFVAQSWELDRIKKMGKAYDGTLNDAVLAMCSGALRRYLITQNDLPTGSLKAMAPVSVRAAGDVDAANAVSFLTADLATNISDPKERMHAIQRSVSAGKEQLRGMTNKEIALYTVLAQSPLVLTTITGTGSKFPAFSTVISNVPGPRNQMYWHGSKLEGIYPASIPFEGFAINFTMVSNCGRLDFGITACRKAAPQLQRLIDYLEDALVELEQAVGLTPPKSSKTSKAEPEAAKAAPEAKRKAAALTTASANVKAPPKTKPQTTPVLKPTLKKGAKPKRKATIQTGLKRKKGPPRKVMDT
ncbi:MAG: diacylglycerol O-acyltransferase [Chitinophagales bacterium]|jgi:diacylglycerol O-acyltransferase